MRRIFICCLLVGGIFGRTLYFGVRREPVSMDPMRQRENSSSLVAYNVFETLVGVEPGSLRIVPRLAIKWKRSRDGKTWIFYLRPGVKFQNGEPLTSREVVYSFKRLVKTSPGKHLLTLLKEVKAQGKDRVVFVLRREFSPFLYVLSVIHTSIVYPSRGKYGPWGTGPYYISLWERGRRMILKKNPYYWGKMGNIDRVVMLFSLPTETVYSFLLREKLDLTNGISLSEVEALRNSGRFYLHSSPVLSLEYLVFNPGDKWVQRAFVREALSYLWNRRWVVLSFSNYREPACRILPLFSSRCLWSYNPGRAAEIVKKNGAYGRVKLNLVYPDDPLYTKIFLPFANEAGKAGIKMKLVAVGDEDGMEKIYRSGTYSLSLCTWRWVYPDPYNLLSFLLSDRMRSSKYPGISSFSGVSSLRRTLKWALRIYSSRRRNELYREVERSIFEGKWIIPLAYLKESLFVNRKISGIEINPLGLVDLSRVYKK